MNAREGRMDATAQPHGISTIIFFAYTLLIMTVGQLCVMAALLAANRDLSS